MSSDADRLPASHQSKKDGLNPVKASVGSSKKGNSDFESGIPRVQHNETTSSRSSCPAKSFPPNAAVPLSHERKPAPSRSDLNPTKLKMMAMQMPSTSSARQVLENVLSREMKGSERKKSEKVVAQSNSPAASKANDTKQALDLSDASPSDNSQLSAAANTYSLPGKKEKNSEESVRSHQPISPPCGSLLPTSNIASSSSIREKLRKHHKHNVPASRNLRIDETQTSQLDASRGNLEQISR